ncbi:disease resistance protein RGA5-like [Miscanthus floridulus]|uniref:disease resistance protein RGA5-like n=1 Tax=Miscanthus floridulus TaxID=154761 RepID=UPI00345ACDEE
MHGIRNVEHNIVPAEANISMEKVRSFNASLCFVDGMPQLSRFQVLRVLALEYCPGMNNQHRLKQIGRLVHLRYLGLVGAGVLELPEETLEDLRFLQTLDLRETDIERWPGTISRLVQLMCLCVRWTRTVPEGMMGSRSRLEDLRLHLVSSNSLKLAAELIRMKRLRVLVLGFQEMDVELEKALVESLGKLPEIQRLEIIYYCKPSTRAVTWEESRWVSPRHLRQLVLGGLLFSRLPSWINRSSLPKLSHLHLGVEVLEDGDLETLARFRKLRSLVLMAAASDEQHHITTVVGSSDDAFNVLNFFSTNMAVRFETGLGGPPMPNLEHVELRVRVAQCADSWLSSLANLPSLDKVTVLLDCQGASAVETVEAEETLRRVTGIHPNRLNPEVTKHNGNDEST